MRKLRFAFLEENFAVSGGMRRIIEISNRLVERGHEVDIMLGIPGEPLECDWLPVKANIKRMEDRTDYDVALINHCPAWPVLKTTPARLKVYYWLGFEGGYYTLPIWRDAYAQDFTVIANSPWIAKMARMVYRKEVPVVLGGLDHDMFRPVKVEKEYELLCCAPEDKPEKGWVMMKRAADLVGLPLENYAVKGLPQDKLAEEYSKAKIFIGLPTIEGSFCPAQEAMACGVPVIMNNAGGNMYYAKDNVNCVIVIRNPGDMAYAIEELRANPKFQEKLVEEGFKTAKEMCWEKTTDRFLEVIYEEYEKTF